MIDALIGKPLEIKWHGDIVLVRRPTVADLVAATDAVQRGDVFMPAWYVWNHVITADGNRMFPTIDAVMSLSGPPVIGLARHIDALYGEGLD